MSRLSGEWNRPRPTYSIMCLVLLGVILGATRSYEPTPSLRQLLLQVTGGLRPTPGRLAGDANYRPWAQACARLSDPNGLLPGLVRIAHARAEAESKGGLWNLALIDLISGKFSQAIAGFELASREPGSAPLALADLSAAYLARFASEGDPIDLLRSVQAAERGLSFSPSDPALLFNRAKALSELGATTQARFAWIRFQIQEESIDWQKEVALQLDQKRDPTEEEKWRLSLPGLVSTKVTEEQIAFAVASSPSQARKFAEEVLLPNWATATSSGDFAGAARSLRLAENIGRVLEKSRGEGLLASAITSIRSVNSTSRRSGHREALLRGLQEFGKGVAQYNEQNLTSAQASLAQAERNLEFAHNPLRLWARFYIAISVYYADADRGLAMLNSLLREVPTDRFAALAGRIEWIVGTVDKVQGRVQSSLRHYDRAATFLRRSGGDGEATFVLVLLAESQSLLGQHSLGWQNRFIAFHRVPSAEGYRRNIAMWIEAKEALVRQGNLALAGPIVEEAVVTAKRWGRPLGWATAYVDRAAYRLEVGKRKGAIADLRQAKRAVNQMEGSPLKRQMTFLNSITEGLCILESQPAKAAGLIRQGLESQEATGSQFEAIGYTVAMAGGELAAGQRVAAEASYEKALSIFESIRSTVEDPVARMQAFKRAQIAFDTLIHLQVGRSDGDREASFRLAERARARVLLELWTKNLPQSGIPQTFVTLAELERRIPPRVVLVSYAVLESEVLAWVIEQGHSRLITLRIDRRHISSLIEVYKLEMARRASISTLRRFSEPLFEALLRPLALHPPVGGTLVIVPDRWLARLPFAALFDRRTGQYLIEQWVVTCMPSATLLAKSIGRLSLSRSSKLSVVAVGVQGDGSYAGRRLPSLPNAPREARRVAKLYEQSSLFLGDDATKDNILRMSSSSDVVHFAGHAVVDLESPARSVLLFAGKSRGSLDPLSLRDLFRLGLDGVSLVVLSACRTQDSSADDRDGVLGLAGAFFAAGVREVVASPWDVRDRSVVPMMETFHQEYRQERSAGEAFRQTVLKLLKSNSLEAKSPATWGGFTVIAGPTRGDERHGH